MFMRCFIRNEGISKNFTDIHAGVEKIVVVAVELILTSGGMMSVTVLIHPVILISSGLS